MKFTPGIAVGAMSGSIGGSTASHNKGGPYFRTRAIPTNPSTPSQLARRAALASESIRWRSLTTAQRDAWGNYARQNPQTNSLGQTISLSGHQIFVGFNTRIILDAGTVTDVPPIVGAPPALLTAVQDGDIGAGATDLTFTATLVSGNKVELWGAVVNSAGIKYVENLYKFIAFSSVDESSPWDDLSVIITALGTLTVDQTLHIKAAQYNPATGQRSPFLHSQVVISSSV